MDMYAKSQKKPTGLSARAAENTEMHMCETIYYFLTVLQHQSPRKMKMFIFKRIHYE